MMQTNFEYHLHYFNNLVNMSKPDRSCLEEGEREGGAAIWKRRKDGCEVQGGKRGEKKEPYQRNKTGVLGRT